jgi:dipeptidyl aminopeptidase/acylaminoacyl peptidase
VARDFLVNNVGEMRASPDGEQAIFTVITPNVETDHNDVKIFSLPLKGGKATALPQLPEDISNIQWSPDGHQIAFIGTIEGKLSVGTFDFRSGRLIRLCDYYKSNRFLSKSGNMLAWSPDGSFIAFSGSLGERAGGEDPLVFSRTQHKTRTALSDGLPVHIYVVEASGGKPKALTAGEYDEHSIDWSPDGKEIIFVSNREKDPDLRFNYDIFGVDVNSGVQRQITRTAGVETDPHISPDGRWIAYLATRRAVTTIDSIAEDTHVWIVPFDGGPGKDLTASLDLRCSKPQWTADSHNLTFLAADHGKVGLFSARTTDHGTTRIFSKNAHILLYEPLRSMGNFLAVVTEATAPPELGVVDPKGEWRAITSINSTVFHPIAPEHVTFKSHDGTPVEGWLYEPKASGKLSTILYIHGGPHGAFGYNFDTRAQYFAARGYAVLEINPRGSSGYGQKFSDGTVKDWGGGDFRDLMSGLDHVLATHPHLDSTNLFVAGGSYGGFMTDWIITQTQRFRAASSIAGVSNLISFYGTSLYQDLIEAEFDGMPWNADTFAHLWNHSPLAYVAKTSTPTLFLHGEVDNDVPSSQSDEMYTALRRKGVPAELVLFPGEGHGLRKPRHRVDEMQRTIDWFDQHRQAAHSIPK